MRAAEQIISELSGVYNSYETDAQALSEAVSRLPVKARSKLPKVLKQVVAGMQDVEFADVVQICRRLEHCIKDFISYYSPEKNGTGHLLALINEIEGYADGRSAPESLDSIYCLYTLPEPESMTPLSGDHRLIREYWEPGRVGDAIKWLIRKQLEAGSFRAWLEQQPFTMQIAKDFAALGLDYAAWDNPGAVLHYSHGKLEQAVHAEDAAVVKALAQKFTRGEYRGYLAIPPKELWKKIAPYYALQTKEQQLKVLAGIQESLKPNTSVEKELQEAAQKMSCEEAEPDASEYNIAFHAWRRKPSHDFCAGNEAGVCTATSGCNSEAMPNYLVDKAVSLIDINIRGKRVGQIYLVAMHKRGKPVLLLDTLEASTSVGMSDALYQPALLAAESIGRQAGFCRIMVQGHAFNAHARNFYRFVQCQPCYELKSETLTKIGSTKPLRVLKQFEHEQEAGGMHYFDAGASFDGEQWRSSWSNVPVQGLVMALKQQG
jgi:hypothetical protein